MRVLEPIYLQFYTTSTLPIIVQWRLLTSIGVGTIPDVYNNIFLLIKH